MSGQSISYVRELGNVVAAVVVSFILIGQTFPRHSYSAPPPLPPVTRTEIMSSAKALAEHHWLCREVNRHAACVRNYRVPWKSGDSVTGVAYNWGGMDDAVGFDRKLSIGRGAGAHKRDGVTSCTAGVDCSGFVSLCWMQRHKYGTATISQVANSFAGNIFRDLLPGDALDKPGSHIVLFAGYNPDGTINVYEASGSESRVVLTKSDWVRFKDYIPIRYKQIKD
jgi:hypothetical protein